MSLTLQLRCRCAYGAVEKVLWPVQHLALGYLGYEVQAPVVSYAVGRVSDDDRTRMVADLRERVRGMLQPPFEAEPIPATSTLLSLLGGRNWTSAV